MPGCRDRKRRLPKSRMKGGISAAIVARMMPEADDSDVLTRRSTEDFADARELPANASECQRVRLHERNPGRRRALEPAPAELIRKSAQTGQQPGRETEFGAEEGDGLKPGVRIAADP